MELALHPVDIAVGAYTLLAVWHGVRRGLASELSRMASMALILLAAWGFYPGLGRLLVEQTRLADQRSANGLAFLGILAGGYVVFLALRLLLKALLEFKFRGRLEKIGGAAAGLVRAAMIVMIVVVAVNLRGYGFFYAQVVEHSATGRVLSRVLMPVYDDLALNHPELRLPISDPDDNRHSSRDEDMDSGGPEQNEDSPWGR